MRQIISASITSSKKAEIVLRLLLAATLALSSLFIAAPAWADEAEQEGEGSASLWFPEALPPEVSLDQEAPEVASEQAPAEGTSLAPQSFNPLETIGGTCGADGGNLTWSLDPTTGTLAITGTGAMANWSTLAPWYDYRDLVSSVTISEGVTSIGNYAFSYCTSLTSITIPVGVASIGYAAFYYCQALASITIPSSVTSIGYDTFAGCTSLASITIPSSVTSIGNSAFAGCTSLTSITIPSSVTSIGSYAFTRCTSLTSITIPSGVTTIGYAAFYRCTTLASISVDPENAAYTSDDSGALFDKAKTELIKFPPKNPQASYVIPEGVISIGYSAFQSCTTLTSIIIPSGVTSIESSTFSGCIALTSITIPSGVTSIESSTFSNCIALTSINIPSGVTSIGREAFSYCTSLTSITIPSGLTSIGDAAFYYCTSLASIAIPYGVTTIEGSTFSGCIALTSITIPSGVVSIGGAAFQNCSLLTSIAVPDSMTTIESYAFAHCTSLTSINIPSDVASIGGFAFYNCASLTSIVIPASTTTIGYAAFYRCTSLASISVNPDNASYTSDDSGALFDKAKTKLIKFPPASPQESYTIPASVTSIGDASIEDASIIGDAFFDCPSLASISVDPGNAVYSSDGYGVLFNKAKTELIKFPPASSQESYVISADVASIRDYAFRGCSFLASILVDPGNAVYSSDGYGVLFNKAKTELIQFPPASPHGNYVIPEGVTSIKCIRGKGGVPDSADYLQGQTTVGNSAFSGCPSLTSVVIPSSMTGIDDSAFAGCTSLVSVSIPTSVTMISIYAFANCISLASVTIPTSVTMILTGAFIGCKGPIYCEAPVKPDGWYLWDLGYDGQVFWGQRAPGPDGTVPVAQHDGIDRMATAVKASQKAYPDPSKVDVVVLAYAYDFPDALAASYLAGALGAPILLTDSGALDAITEEEIRRLAPSTVYIVGGTGSVSDTVAGAVGAYPSVSSVTRLGGEGREETAYLIACEAAARRGAPSTAFVADAKNFPDALSAGSLAASQGAPILLTGTGTLDFWAQRFLEESAIGDIVVVGGPGSVPAQVEEQLRSLSHGPAVTRWSGTDRYETSADALNKGIAKWGINPTVIGLASGDDFPDALVGGAAIGGRGGLLAITDPDELSVAAVSLINTYKGAINGVEIFGGPGTIRVQGAVQTLLG